MMRISMIAVGLVALAAFSLFAYVEASWDKQWDVPMPTLKVSTAPEVVARGEYLARGPAHCVACHGDFDDFSGNLADVPMSGGNSFEFPLATLWTANLTPDASTGIRRHEDALLFRFLRHAVKADGTGSIPLMMPFAHMADEDHVAIVSYLRTLEPIEKEIPAPSWSFLGKVIRVFSPPMQPVLDPLYPARSPEQAPTVERGRYIAHDVANCFGCHTQISRMTLEQLAGDFGGGAEFEPGSEVPGGDPTLAFRAVNLTPHESSTLARFNKKSWVARFRAGRAFAGSPMPWEAFSRISDADLEALWVYFNSIEPVDNAVVSTFRTDA